MNYDTDNFQKDVIEKSYEIPVLVDFWAEWCGPCKILGPVLERLALQNGDSWMLVKLNTEKYPQIAAQYGIRSIPNVKLFVNGEVKDEFVGALPEHAIVQWLKKALPGKYADELKKAQELLSGQKVEAARKLLNKILSAETDNHLAALLLAQTYLFSNPSEALNLIGKIEEGTEYWEQATPIRMIAGFLLSLEKPDNLPEGDVKADYLNAIKNLKENNFESALQGFIQVMENDRKYDEDGARKACIAIFKLLGEDHPLTRKYRPVFSRALYV